jgi:hypothetical protein
MTWGLQRRGFSMNLVIQSVLVSASPIEAHSKYTTDFSLRDGQIDQAMVATRVRMHFTDIGHRILVNW